MHPERVLIHVYGSRVAYDEAKLKTVLMNKEWRWKLARSNDHIQIKLSGQLHHMVFQLCHNLG